MQNAVDTA